MNDARDEILRGLLPDLAVRVVVASTTATAREAARRHRSIGGPAVALGRSAAAGLLLATLTKDRERVSVQILGNGPLGAIIVDANSAGEVRAFVKHAGLPIPASPGHRVSLGRAVGTQGVVSVLRDLGMRDNFSGQTPIIDGEIDTDLEHYLSASEQIDSVLACDAILGAGLDVVAAGGVLLQALPKSDAAPFLADMRTRVRETLAELLADGPPKSAEEIARAILGEAASELKVLDVRPVDFACPCSRDRAAGTVGLIDPADLVDMIAKGEDATVTCEFCREQYVFTGAELEAIRTEAMRASASRS